MPKRAMPGDRRTRKGGVYEKQPNGRWKRVSAAPGAAATKPARTPAKKKSKVGVVKAANRAARVKKQKEAQKKAAARKVAQNKKAAESVRKAQESGNRLKTSVSRLERAAKNLERAQGRTDKTILGTKSAKYARARKDVAKRTGPPPLAPALRRQKEKKRLKAKREREMQARLRKEERAQKRKPELPPERHAPVEKPAESPKPEGLTSRFKTWARNAWARKRRRD